MTRAAPPVLIDDLIAGLRHFVERIGLHAAARDGRAYLLAAALDEALMEYDHRRPDQPLTPERLPPARPLAEHTPVADEIRRCAHDLIIHGATMSPRAIEDGGRHLLRMAMAVAAVERHADTSAQAARSAALAQRGGPASMLAPVTVATTGAAANDGSNVVPLLRRPAAIREVPL